MRLKFHPEARVDLKEGKAFYRHRSPLAAVAFAHEIDVAISRITESPLRYPESEHGTRAFVLPWRFPYTVVYQIKETLSIALDARERGDIAFLDSYAELHRTWMITTSWPEMLARTMELLAAGTIQIIGDVVWIDGAPGPCRFGEAPRVCHEPETMLARGIPRSCPFIE